MSEPVDTSQVQPSRYSSLLAKVKLDTASKVTVAEQADGWFYDIWSLVQGLTKDLSDCKSRISALEAENIELKSKQTINLAKQMSDLFKDNKSSNDIHMSIVKKLDSHLQQKSKIENNIVITGVKESETNDDKEQVSKIMTTIGIDPTKILRTRRIRRSPTSKNKDKPKLEMIIAEFNDQPTQQAALTNSYKLKDNETLKGIFIHPDRTLQEQILDNNLRKDRNDKNEALPHGEGRHRYDVESSGNKAKFRFHYGVRFAKVVKIYEREATKIARESTNNK